MELLYALAVQLGVMCVAWGDLRARLIRLEKHAVDRGELSTFKAETEGRGKLATARLDALEDEVSRLIGKGYSHEPRSRSLS
ncbi:MAG: hypothetical protein V2I43_01615 [Parvularcula sp.]|jgi:hypothetical protein|nr:hypothetical protein [Parvularcula sp.]